MKHSLSRLYTPYSSKPLVDWAKPRIFARSGRVTHRHKWPIASHFHSGGFEFSYLGEDLDEPVGEPEQTLAGVGVCERTAEHLHEMLGGEQDVDDPVKACTCWGRGCLRLGGQMPGFRAGLLELAFKIGESHIDVTHGHGGVDVAKQLHQNGEADAGAKHLSGVGMPELMGDDICGKTERVADQVQVIAELDQDSHLASGSRKEPSIGGQWIQGAEEA